MTPSLQVARALLTEGPLDPTRSLERPRVLRLAGVKDGTFRSAASELGARHQTPGLGFFSSDRKGLLAFGPGAGLAVGVSLGSQSLRTTIMDANGWHYCEHQSDYEPGQLAQEPDRVLDRIRDAVCRVIDKAFADERLLVDGQLPLLGWGVAWPTAINRERKPVGNALSHPLWRSMRPLDQRVRRHMGVDNAHSFALNDGHAAAVAVAHRMTHQREHESWRFPRLSLVLRLAGGVGSGIIIIEPRPRHQAEGKAAGFEGSILVGGFDNHAGEIAHVPISQSLIEELNRGRPHGLGPIAPVHCTCTPATESAPRHLESVGSAHALAARIDPHRPMHKVLADVRNAPGTAAHKRALTDTGRLVAEALLGPVAMLNPASITLTGSLALEPVRAEIDAHLADAHQFGTQPEVLLLGDNVNRFIRARGAALAVIRYHVHRRLGTLFEGSKTDHVRRVEELTVKLAENHPLRHWRAA